MRKHSTMIPTWQLSSTSLFFLLLLLLSISSCSSVELASSDHRTLLRLNHLLSEPSQLSVLNSTSLCSLRPTTSLTLSCTSTGRLSSFLLTGNSSLTSASLSLSSILPTLSHLRSLSHLTLSSLSLTGPLPTTVSHLPPLRSLNLSSNLLSGHLPDNLLKLHSLRSLDLSSNLLKGSLPDLSNLTTLANLDLSHNQLSGAIPNSIIALPAISTLNLSGNAFSGELTSPSTTCGDLLTVVDVSDNRLVGKLPGCISSNTSHAVRVLDNWNCLASSPAVGIFQHPPSYCEERPLAALPTNFAAGAGGGGGGGKGKMGLVLIAVGGVLAAVGVVGLAAVVVWRRRRRRDSRCGVDCSAKVTWESRRRTETALWATPYRVFEEEEVEEMTGEFDHSNLVEEHQNTQMELYRGWLQDGTAVFVGKLELMEKLTRSSLKQFIDIVSKLQHHHLIDILGHSVVINDKNANETMVYLVFERFSNGTLRSHLNGWRRRETMKWPQRVAASVGVARGIQFLHTCGIYGNNINMEDILMDEALTPKINNYTLPIPNGNKNNNKGTTGTAASNLSNQNMDIGSKQDIYKLGEILIELITGKSASNEEELEALKLQLQKILTESVLELHRLVDPGINGTYTYESLRTMTEITLSCLSRDHSHRPSIDDVLWHLQYSIQVQYACASSGSLSLQSFSITT